MTTDEDRVLGEVCRESKSHGREVDTVWAYMRVITESPRHNRLYYT